MSDSDQLLQMQCPHCAGAVTLPNTQQQNNAASSGVAPMAGMSAQEVVDYLAARLVPQNESTKQLQEPDASVRMTLQSVKRRDTASAPGAKTTEFWLHAGAMLFTVLQSSDLFPHEDVRFKVVSVAATWFGALGYAGCRTLVKRKL